MVLTAGTKLGPYEIQSPLGAGGMGEVYRARDARLNRDVAIKVLPAGFTRDPERLRRFQQEAEAVAALNHPNILAIHDFGEHEGVPYIVAEFLEGETLRERLRPGMLPVRKVTEYSEQMARGLAAAHEKGMVHRDLKPENVFVTRDGRVKILDFGLAKLTRPEGTVPSDAATLASQTEPGVVMGTVGYMSPEQVKGLAADHRSDLFSFGAILYEMLSGKRAFHGDTSVETMSAILKQDPPELTETNRTVPPALERIVRHCLEKNPEERFQSAHDLAFDLESVTSTSTTTKTMDLKPRLPWRGIAVVAGLVLLVTTGVLITRGWLVTPTNQPKFRRLTFRRGTIRMARFAPDDQTIVYGAAWDGNAVELFNVRYDSSDSRAFGLGSAQVLGISKTGEVALLVNPSTRAFVQVGTLARMPLNGGAPRELLDNVQFADWSPDGTGMAVVRYAFAADASWIEYPVGKVIYRGAAWIGNLRISPDGNLLAFAEHINVGDDGRVTIIDRNGSRKFQSQVFDSLQGLAWRPDGKEVWFTAAPIGADRALYGLNLTGKQRLILRVPGALVLHDIADGRVLLTNENARKQMFVLPRDETKERNLSWLDWSGLQSLSEDGKVILFSESGEATRAAGVYGVYLRRLDGSAPVRMGDGLWSDLSLDGRWVVVRDFNDPPQFVLLPTRAGESRQITHDNLTHLYPQFTPDGKAIVFIGRAPRAGLRVYYQPLDGGEPVAVTPEGIAGSGASHGSVITLSPDGAYLIAPSVGSLSYAMYPVHGGQPRPLEGIAMNEAVVGWSADGKSLFTYRRGDVPAKIYRIEIATGRRELFKQTSAPDLAGVEDVTGMRITRDGRSYAYSCNTVLSDLYVVEGLR